MPDVRSRLTVHLSILFAAIASLILGAAVGDKAAAQSLGATWRMNLNGVSGDLVLNQAADGALTGTLFGDPVAGFYSTAAPRKAVIVRFSGGQPSQILVADVPNVMLPLRIDGAFYALSTASGASLQRNVFSFAANRVLMGMGVTPTNLPAQHGGAAGPASIARALTLTDRPNDSGFTVSTTMTLAQAADGALSATTANGDQIFGSYAPDIGTAAFVRLRNGGVRQAYIGRPKIVAANGLAGDYFAVTADAGASLARIRYDWDATPPPSGGPADITGAWKINGNGTEGDLTLVQNADGTLSGTIYGDAVHGYYATLSRELVLVRTSTVRKGRFTTRVYAQAYVGDVAMSGDLMTGLFYGTSMIASGANQTRNAFRFAARRGALTAPTILPPPQATPGPSSLAGEYTAYDRHAEFQTMRPSAFLVNQTTAGSVSGTLGGLRIDGYYSAGTGSVAFYKRDAAGNATHLYVGGPAPAISQFSLAGDYYPLLPAAGATPARLKFDWKAKTESIAGVWKINGNGAVGDLVLSQGPDGALSGTMYGNPVRGFYAKNVRDLVLLRGPTERPFQAFIGNVTEGRDNMNGTFFSLNAPSGGGSSAQNEFRFAARRATDSTVQAPSSLPQAPGGNQGPDVVAGAYTFFDRQAEFQETRPAGLNIGQTAEGNLSGDLGGGRIEGHYAAARGKIGFIKFSGATPVGFFEGNTTPGLPNVDAIGSYYPLSVADGATADRLKYDWKARVNSLTGFEIFRGAEVEIGALAVRDVSASCPGGKTALGVGYATRHITAPIWHYGTEIKGAMPSGSGGTVRVRNANTGFSRIGVRVILTCVDPAPEIYAADATYRPASDGFASSATAACNPGDVAIGGGFMAEFDAWPNDGAPTETGYASSALRVHPAASAIGVAVRAICAPRSLAADAHVVTAGPLVWSGRSNQALELDCPGRERLISSGFTMTGRLWSGGRAPLANDLNPKLGGGGVRASASNRDNGSEVTVGLRSVCASVARAVPE